MTEKKLEKNKKIENLNFFPYECETNADLFNPIYLKKTNEEIAKLNIKGFRKGSVPREVGIKYLDKDKITQQVYWEIINMHINKLKKNFSFLKINNFLPFAKKIEDLKIEKKSIKFKVFFNVIPSVKVENYKKITTIFEDIKLEQNYAKVPCSDKMPGSNDIVILKMFAINNKKQMIEKYNWSFLEIDLQNSNLNKELIDEIKKCNLNEEHKFKITINNEELDFQITVFSILKKQEINNKYLEKINKSSVSIEKINEEEQEKNNKNNEEYKEIIVLKWINSSENILSYVPEEFIDEETKLMMKKYLKKNKKYNNDELKNLYQKIFFDNFQNLKMFVTLKEISKIEKVICDKNEIKEFFQELKGETNENVAKLKEEEVMDLLTQKKTFKYLQTKIIFSN